MSPRQPVAPTKPRSPRKPRKPTRLLPPKSSDGPANAPDGREREYPLAEIKSALELALEKAERYGKASQEEMAAAQYQEQGRQLAVEYLRGEGDLEAGLKGLPPQGPAAARAAIKEVLLRNIGLPRNGEAAPRLGLAVGGVVGGGGAHKDPA